MEKVERLSEKTERLKFVCQSGGNNAKVKWVVEGLESIVVANIMFNNPRTKITPKGAVNVFDLNDKWLGQIRYENGIPKKYKADGDLSFSDLYVKGE